MKKEKIFDRSLLRGTLRERQGSRGPLTGFRQRIADLISQGVHHVCFPPSITRAPQSTK